MSRPRVIVLMGGPDAERAVSLMSGREIAAALRDTGRFEVVEEVIDVVDAAQLRPLAADVVFPALHGRWGEGGPLQDVLEQLGVPYVGSTPGPAREAMDKLVTKRRAAELGVPTPDATELRPGEPCPLPLPLVIKPVDDGSSVDLRLCRSDAELVQARRELEPIRPRLMAETLVDGRELTVGLLDGTPLPVIEIRPTVEFYDYDAKYLRDDTEYRLEPALPDGLASRLAEWSRRVHDRLGCRDVARVDFMLDERGADPEAWFLEINTMPGFTTHSLVPMAAAHTGVPMPALCGDLVDRALARGRAARVGATG